MVDVLVVLYQPESSRAALRFNQYQFGFAQCFCAKPEGNKHIRLTCFTTFPGIVTIGGLDLSAGFGWGEGVLNSACCHDVELSEGITNKVRNLLDRFIVMLPIVVLRIVVLPIAMLQKYISVHCSGLGQLFRK